MAQRKTQLQYVYKMLFCNFTWITVVATSVISCRQYKFGTDKTRHKSGTERATEPSPFEYQNFHEQAPGKCLISRHRTAPASSFGLKIPVSNIDTRIECVITTTANVESMLYCSRRRKHTADQVRINTNANGTEQLQGKMHQSMDSDLPKEIENRARPDKNSMHNRNLCLNQVL